MDITVIIPTHNPDPARLDRTLSALRNQTLPLEAWETILVDNASRYSVDALNISSSAPANLQIVNQPVPGLSAARKKGIQSARGQSIVFVDDDNVLEPDYLEKALALMQSEPALGITGGRSFPEFEKQPESWVKEFYGLLALRDMGDEPLRASWNGEYPECSPIGAGMVLRKNAATAWLKSDSDILTDRKGTDLSSGGDNDIVLYALKAGWIVGYDPSLRLTHLIPEQRLQQPYLARLNRGIQKSWMQVLTKHKANPWPVIESWTVPLRQAKAWFSCRGWASVVNYINWQGACGHFEGRIKR